MRLRGRHILLAIITLVVLGTIVTSLFVMGPPAEERERRFDVQRVSELQQISSTIDGYWNANQKLPQSLETLSSNRNFYISSLNDPKTKALYEYMTTASTTYQLCATFDRDSSSDGEYPYPRVPAPYERFWVHPEGRHCFSLEVQKWPK